jgi:hypothetical protein
MIKVHERIFGPKALAQFFTRDHLPRTFQQRDQKLKRLHLQFEPVPVATQFGGAKISFVIVKPVFQNRGHEKREALS